MWVELPAAEDRPKRSRRGRGRGRNGAEAQSDAVAETPVELAPEADVEVLADTAPEPVAAAEPAAEAAPKGRKPRASRAKKALIDAVIEARVTSAMVETPLSEETLNELEAILEHEPEVAAEPAPRVPDPADISAAPPPAPRKGWWRRG